MKLVYNKNVKITKIVVVIFKNMSIYCIIYSRRLFMAFVYIENEDKSLTVEDTIYGKIIVSYPFSEIVLTKEMQRLSGISQNGFSQLVFRELEQNDRLSHSVGAFYVMSLFLKRLEEILKNYNIELSKDDKDIALCSMLLHDIGHGPFSHSLELVTNYSHEKRTTDILLGDTEVNQVITRLFGKQKVKKIASFIAEINDKDEIGKDSFTKLLNNLVSYQLDADRIDYLLRDSHYVGIACAIDLKRIISNLNVVVNNNQEYELLIDRRGLASIENVLLQRYQMYRDVYLSPISVLGDSIFEKIIERYRNSTVLHSIPVSTSFNILVSDPRVSNLSDFLKMKDEDFKKSFEILADTNLDFIMAYLCDFSNIDDYILIKNDISLDKIKNKLKEIFGNIDLENTFSVISIGTKTKLYKKEQKLNIQNGNRIMDLTECTNLIRPQEVLEDSYIFFNPELLRIELGLSIEEFKKYDSEVRKMIEELNKKPEEFELKYIVGDNHGEDILLDQDALLKQILSVFISNGFEIVSTTEKQNNDEYYDTRDLNLFKNGGSLRIRKVEQKGKEKIKATCKMPLEKGEVYSSRSEIEENLPDASFETFRQKMIDSNVAVNFEDILKFPILNSRTKRTDVVLDKNGVQVCLSFDNSKYTNHTLNNEMSVTDRMIEIEAIGELNNRIILNEIHEFITSSFPGLIVNKQSKYERGINRTLQLHNYIQEQESITSIVDGHSAPGVEVLVKKLQKEPQPIS